MRKPIAALAAVAVSTVVVCSQALAQEQAAFRLKFKQGQVVRFRGYVKGAANISMAVQPAPPTPMPTEIAAQGAGTVVASAKAVRQDQWGNTRLRVSLDSLKMSADLLGKKFEMALEGGKMTMKGDGKVISSEQLPKLPGGQTIPLLQKPVEVKLGTRGQLMDIVIPGFEKEMAQMRKMYGGVDPLTMWKQTQLLLPENPVTVGESWADHQEQPIPGAASAAVTDTTFTLTDIKEVNGQKIATITVNSNSVVPNFDMGAAMQQSMPPGSAPMPAMQGNMTMQSAVNGTALFNIAAGLMDRFDFRMDFAGQMAMNAPTPPEAGQGGQGGQGGQASMAMNMQGQFQGAVARIK